MARSGYSRFQDNMGRAERRLAEAIRNEENDLKRRAYQNQKDRIHEFREKVREQKQNKTLDLNKALDQWKNRKDLSGGKKTAEEVEKSRLQSELSGDMTKNEIDDIFENYGDFDEGYQDFYELMLVYNSIKGSYVGQSADDEKRQNALNLREQLQELGGGELDDDSDETRLRIMQELDWALNASGNPGKGFSGVLGLPINRTLYEGSFSESYDFSDTDEY